MTDIDIPALKAAALAATPGPWKSALATVKSIPAECVVHVDPERTWSAEYEPGWETVCRWKADAAYISLANPATVLALIERMEKLEAVAKSASQLLKYQNTGGSNRLGALWNKLIKAIAALEAP